MNTKIFGVIAAGLLAGAAAHAEDQTKPQPGNDSSPAPAESPGSVASPSSAETASESTNAASAATESSDSTAPKANLDVISGAGTVADHNSASGSPASTETDTSSPITTQSSEGNASVDSSAASPTNIPTGVGAGASSQSSSAASSASAANDKAESRPAKAQRKVLDSEKIKVSEEELDNRVTEINKASTFIGMAVHNLKDEKIGKISDLVFDPKTGKIAYAVMSDGGTLGLRQKLMAIPITSFRASPGDDHLVIDATKEQIDQTTGFTKDNWPALNDPAIGGPARSASGKATDE